MIKVKWINRFKELSNQEYGFGNEAMAAHFAELAELAERRQEMKCSVCQGKGTVLGYDAVHEPFVRHCPECDGFGSITKMLESPPKVNLEARVVRKIEKHGLQPVYLMNDDTFRIYCPLDAPIPIPHESGIKHFTHGRIQQKTDEEISQAASYLVSASGVQYFHEDGTPHS